MNRFVGIIVSIGLAAGFAVAERTAPAVFHVDSEAGNDNAAGTRPDTAWRTLDKVNTATLIPGDRVLFKRGGLWRGQLTPQSGAPDARILYGAYGDGAKPILQGSVARDQADEWNEVRPGLWATRKLKPIPLDVGIVILNHGEKWGVKKWALEEVKAPLDYWYDPDGKRIFLAWPANPAEAFHSVELALTRHIINQGNKHDITYDGLAIRYGASHGFGGGNTQRITIRNCDLSWIGGGLQYWKTRKDGTRYPVRFGNAIEFWSGARDHLVERNRIWEVYDAALTNQGNGDDSHQINIIYRDNVIWNSEYSFEFWNRPASVVTSNIVFEFNTCVDAGICWSHAQRPNPNGAHLMFYHNPSKTSDFIVRNNIFCRSSDRCTRMWNVWDGAPTLSNNLYWSPDKPIMRWTEKTDYAQSEFVRYQSELRLDQGSLVGEPQFVNPAARDYRLKPGSPGSTLATDGGPVGARIQ